VSWVRQLARADIVALKSYEHASWEPTLVRLHANELPWRSISDDSEAGLNRYPEPQPSALLERLSALYGVPKDSLLLARGSDEAIDLLVRAFCRAGQDAVLVCPPTFAMYRVAAQIQGARVITVPLKQESGFQLDTRAVIARCAPEVKIVFLCSPNNPTGNLIAADEIRQVLLALARRALVVVDEAYIEFSANVSLATQTREYPHLAVLRTLSKAHGMAGARLGSLIADPEVIQLLRKLIAPYAIPQLTLEAALKHLSGRQHQSLLRRRVGEIVKERTRVHQALRSLPGVVEALPSDANFVLARFKNPEDMLSRARTAQLLVRDARGYPNLEDALRISIGTPEQNDALLRCWA
jgi:histidinol-phosphate aminotransferase